MIDFNFYQNYRQRYTVIPITTIRGPSKLICELVSSDKSVFVCFNATRVWPILISKTIFCVHAQLKISVKKA